jgi:hypothetical protein
MSAVAVTAPVARYSYWRLIKPDRSVKLLACLTATHKAQLEAELTSDERAFRERLADEACMDPHEWSEPEPDDDAPPPSRMMPVVTYIDAVARLSTCDIFEPIPPRQWICEPIELAPGAPTMLGGLGFSGKTILAQDLALAIATGTQAWEAFDCTRGRVVHFDYEQGRSITCDRYQRMARARGTDVDELIGGEWLSCVIFPSKYIDEKYAEQWLTRETEGMTLAVIDSFRAAAPTADENSSASRIHLDTLGRVSGKTGCAFLVLHHAKKPPIDGGSGPDRNSLRGSGALFDACQAVIVATPALPEVTRMKDGEEQTVRDAQPAKIAIEKARISGRTSVAPMTFAIDDVELDDDPRAGLAVSVTPPLEKQALSERMLAALRGAKKPITKGDLKARLKCSGTALTAALAKHEGQIEKVEIEVRGKAEEGLALKKGKP